MNNSQTDKKFSLKNQLAEADRCSQAKRYFLKQVDTTDFKKWTI